VVPPKILSYDDILDVATRNAEKKTYPYQFIILDEAQDTSDQSFKLLDTVCGTNSFLQTGDPKQTLYGSKRGYDKVSYHLQGFKIYNLTKNFRSYKKIVEYGNEVAKQKGGLENKGLTQKRRIDNEKKFFDDVVDSIAMLDENGEIIFLDEQSAITPYLDNGDTTYILVGTNKEIEEIRKNQNFGKSFYDIAPSKVSDSSDLIPFFSSLVSMDEKSIYENLPEAERLIDGVGEKAMEKIFEWFDENPNVNKPVSELLQELEKQNIPPDIKEKFYKMYQFFEMRKIIINKTMSTTDIKTIKNTLLEQVEILYHNTKNFIPQHCFTEASYKYLKVFIKNFCDNYNLPLKDFINEFSKSIKEDYGSRYLNNGISKKECQYSISTIHNSKGKEFENVILIFNSNGNLATIGVNLYVGVTRAKKRLIIVGMPREFIISDEK